MKKNFLTFLLLITSTFGVISACGPTSEPTTSQNEIVTGIDIGGASSVYVGETIKLIAQVNGTNNQKVTWTSEDSNIATVDNNGTVTGVKTGKVNIIATSDQDPNFSAKKEINVSQRKTEGLIIDLLNKEGIDKNENGIYCLPIGRHYQFKVDTTTKNAAIPDDLLYEVITPSDVISSQFIVNPDENDSTIASFIGFAPANGITLKVTGNYKDLSTAPLIASITFNLLDEESNNRTIFKEALITAQDFEEKNMSSAEIFESFKTSTPYFYNKQIEIAYCENQTYSHYSKEYYGEDRNITEQYTIYNGLYHNNYINENHFYSFKYNSNEVVEKVYFNETATENDNRYKFAGFEQNDTVTFGIINRLNNLMYSDTPIEGGAISFNNSYAFSASRYEFNSNDYGSQHIVKAEYLNDETNQKNNLSLLINYDNEGKIKSYDLSQSVYNSNNELINSYSETAELQYSQKPSNSEYSKNIDINDYFLEDFSLVICNEKTDYYDYSDTSKYGAESMEITSEGIRKYRVFKNKTLVLKVQNNGSNTKASTLIDRIEAKSSNPNVIKDPILTGSDIFAINPYKDNHDNIALGEAKLTFTSSRGVELEIIVKFVNTELKKIYTTHVPENNDFGEIFKGRESTYFFINTDPDEDIYTFYIDITEGNNNGIELFRYDYDNPFSYPGFSYAIRGLETGSYKFKIGIEGSSIKTEETYSIVVKDPFSIEYLQSKLVDSQQIYTYSTGTFEAFIRFISNSQIEIESHLLGMNPVSATIDFKFETGKIVIENAQTLPGGMYFQHIQKGEIYFDKDLSNLTIFMSISSDDNSSQDNIRYVPFTFTKFVDKTNLPEYVNGNSYSSDVFIIGSGMLLTKLEFTSSTGTFTILTNENETILKASFNYTYDKIATAMMLTDIRYDVSNENLYIDDEIYFNDGLSRLEVKILENNSYDYNISYFSI